MAKRVTITLTEAKARHVWAILDGASDAGACEGGLTPAERKAIQSAIDQILDQLPHKRKTTTDSKER